MKISTLILMLVLACSTTFGQSYVFNRADILTKGSIAQSVAMADFDGDGILDIAVVIQSDSTLQIFHGKPDATFETTFISCGLPCGNRYDLYPLGSYPESIAVGDLNHDGKPDLVVTNALSNTVSVFLGNGDGTFQPPVQYGTGDFPYGVVIADFNRDGNPDLAVTNDQDNTISILLGNGDGTFQGQNAYATSGHCYQLVVGDFNGDQKLDLATANSPEGTISVLLGNGDGTFQTYQDYPANSGIGLVTGDFNRDGKLDLAANNPNGVSVLLGNGDGTFQPAVSYPVAGASWVTAGDVNNDGKLDLVVPTTSNTVAILLGNGDGTFKSAASYGVGASPAWVALGDITRDGVLDLAVANSYCTDFYCASDTSTVSLLIGNGDGTFGRSASTTLKYLTHAITEGDFAGNGQPDLAVGVAEPQVDVLLNSQGKFPTSVAYPNGDQEGADAIVTADFNGDGYLDLATYNGGDNTVSILFGNGNGTFQASVSPSPYSTGLSGNNGVASLIVADLNGDGHPDLLAFGGSGTAVLLNSGNGTFTMSPQNDFLASYGGYGAAGDFNGDGKVDLALAVYNPSNNTSSIYILLGNGDGTFNLNSVNSFPAPNSPTYLAAADLDGDGKLDLVVACQPPFTNVLPPALVSVLLGNGDGTFQTHVDYPLGGNTGPTQIVIADWNSDGIPDIGVANQTGTFSILLGLGSGGFSYHVDYLTPGFPTSLTAADFNGDGGTDLAVTNEISGTPKPNTVSVFLNSSVIALYPSAVSFGDQPVGTSGTQTITVSNSGSAAMSMSSITISGSDFTQTNNCGSSLAPRANCTITVSFTPRAKENYSGKIALRDSAEAGHQTVSLSGTGVEAAVKVSASTLSFGSQTVDTTSAAKSVRLTNTGNATLTITDIAITGTNPADFSETNTCGSSLSPGNSCAISVTFTPKAEGSRSAEVSITDNAGGSPQKVTLTGTGK